MTTGLDDPRSAQDFDRETYAPILFITLATRYTRSASQLYLKRFGIGVTEWRIVSILSFETNVTANEIANIISTNKAAVSRSLATLSSAGFIQYVSSEDPQRKRLISLTAKGRTLNAQIVPVVLERERLLLAKFSAEEKLMLLDFLRRLNQAMPDVEAYDQGS